jgi:diketogulonate reductase-like aldo/keto reductase
LRREGVIAIPKAANAEHVLENRRARDFELDADELRRLDQSQRRASRRRRLSFLERI